MVLKYRTDCRPPANSEEGVRRDQWNFIDGIIGASVYYDTASQSTVVALEFDSRASMKISLCDEAYLLNENGKTIEKFKCH